MQNPASFRQTESYILSTTNCFRLEQWTLSPVTANSFPSSSAAHKGNSPENELPWLTQTKGEGPPSFLHLCPSLLCQQIRSGREMKRYKVSMLIAHCSQDYKTNEEILRTRQFSDAKSFPSCNTSFFHQAQNFCCAYVR